MPAHTNCREPLLDLVTRSLDEQPLPISTVARSLIRMTADPTVSLGELSRVVSADPGLTGKIVKMANSAFYTGPEIVSSIPSAILKLGITATRSIAITASVQGLYRGGGAAELEHDLWQHSLAVGVGARIIAQHAAPPLAEEAFLSGLLHDIAKLVLIQRFPDVYKPILRRTLGNDESPLDVELTSMGFTHADLSAMILERWAFGPVPIRAVRFHHDPDRADSSAESSRNLSQQDARRLEDARRLAHAIGLANALAKRLGGASPITREINLPCGPTLKYFKFTQDQLSQMSEEMSFRVGDELQVFGQPDTPMFVSRHRPCRPD
jgi:HD-like signal output (HDOD) protein